MENTENQSPARRAATPGLRAGLWAGGIYLAFVATFTAWALHSTATWDQPDANLAGVVPFLITAPWSLIPLGFIDLDVDTAVGTVLFLSLPVIGALINAGIIGFIVHKIVRLVSSRRPGTAPRAHPA